MMDIIGDSTLTTLQAPASISADGNTAGVDCRSLIGQGGLILTALNTAGTNPTLAVKLQGTQDADVVTSVTAGSNTGTGRCTQVYGGPDAVAEDITVTIKSGATTASVVGSVSGALADATIGTLYQSAKVEFLLTQGGAAFVENDSFVIVTTARTYADVSGGAFTGLTGASQASIQKLNIDCDKLPRYLRVNYDIGGTNSPAYTVAVAAQSATN
jgi:hypothetical protein